MTCHVIYIYVDIESVIYVELTLDMSSVNLASYTQY
jgi:hypothetical protein